MSAAKRSKVPNMFTDRNGTRQFYRPQRGNNRSSKRPVKKRPVKKSSTDTDWETVTAPPKKFKSRRDDDFNVNYKFGYRIINFMAVFATISKHLKCKKCSSDVAFHEKYPRGLGFKIVIVCPNCPDVAISSSKFIRNEYEINRRFVLTMRLLGIGLHGMEKFCAFMELRPIFQSFYQKAVELITVAAETVRKASMTKAAQEEKTKSEENGQYDGITVSSEGLWKKREFSSLFGITSLIGWFTGKIVDVEVKSEYCESCEDWKDKSETTEYEEWYVKHADECPANHRGSSDKMVVDAVVEMFERSEALHNLKYAEYIGDGDSKIFKAIKDKHPYDYCEVQEKECIDRVQKRMGGRLRNLKKEAKGLEGELTAELIDQLTIDYGLAIRRNPNSLENMKDQIWAILLHKSSTDENPQHDKCSETWCDWKRAEATGSLDTYRHQQPLSAKVLQAIEPVFEDLSRDELLNRCLGGYTQNSNESFDATVWKLAPKSYASGKKILNLATDLAVCNFNDGLVSILRIFKILEIDIGIQLYNFCIEADALRIKYAVRSLTDAATVRTSKKEYEEANCHFDGQLYGPGIAD